MDNHVLPLDAAWQLVDKIGPIIWWTKGVAGLLVAVCILLLPQPVRRTDAAPHGVSSFEWVLVMYSRVGIIVGGHLLLFSVITPINAFGPLGDFIFFPAMATNLLCLIWCRRKSIFTVWRLKGSPEYIVVRALIAGKPSDR
jgi:hypothetical protein